MNVHAEVIDLAAKAHRRGWASGSDVGIQTKRSNAICRDWQAAVKARFPARFEAEHRLNQKGRCQQIDLVDLHDRVAYELKASPNNVHMEIYRDVFKALVFNQRNPDLCVTRLVFIAPRSGIQKLGESFPEDVKTIARKLHLELEIVAL